MGRRARQHCRGLRSAAHFWVRELLHRFARGLHLLRSKAHRAGECNGARMRILITGSSGLIGSEAVVWLDAQGYAVLGVDNNMRREFFGPKGDTSWMLTRYMSERAS